MPQDQAILSIEDAWQDRVYDSFPLGVGVGVVLRANAGGARYAVLV